MKNIIYIITFLALMSCTENFEELNTDPTKSVGVDLGALFNGISKSTQGIGQNQTFMRNEIFYEVAEVTALSRKIGVDPVSRSTDLWSNYYKAMKNIRRLEEELEKFSQEEFSTDITNALAMLHIIKAHFTLRTTDAHGDMPYSEAGYAFSLENQVVRPKFDSQGDIYTTSLNELSAAAASIVVNSGDGYLSFASYDYHYSGDMSKWKALANTLILKYALRMSDKDESGAASFISSALSGVMQSAADQFVLDRSNYNSGRTGGWRAAGSSGPRLGETIWPYFTTDVNAFDGSAVVDPRINILFAYNEDGEWRPCSQGFASLDPVDERDVYNYGSEREAGIYSPVNISLLRGENTTRPILNFAENCFYIAEVYDRGLGAGKDMVKAEEWYYKGVEASVNFYKEEMYDKIPDWESVDGTPAPDFSDFMSNMKTHSLIEFNGTDDEKLDKIYAQRWINSFWQPEEAFYLMKRTGGRTPHSTLPVTTYNRLVYPASEADQNVDNYNDQIAIMDGGDETTTKIWWMP